ncbi:50S ribosomal protein L28 [Buchnera aphidicola (Taiwanaphis decaspermi)]|uniref:50S ribosomal protein L28 n=1 Tax=Buchnera aphidicola TaxID=9 RepID=UPI0031B89A39
MSKICELTGKKSMVGNKRSHAMNKNKKRFLANIHWHKIWLNNEKKFVKMKLSKKGLRLINKKGIENIIF